MTCKYCNIHSNEFKTELEFITFKKSIVKLINTGVLIKMFTNDKNLPFSESNYYCTRCNQEWVLYEPDQAYRGGWYEKK
jgi:hypothetical protein